MCVCVCALVEQEVLYAYWTVCSVVEIMHVCSHNGTLNIAHLLNMNNYEYKILLLYIIVKYFILYYMNIINCYDNL